MIKPLLVDGFTFDAWEGGVSVVNVDGDVIAIKDDLVAQLMDWLRMYVAGKNKALVLAKYPDAYCEKMNDYYIGDYHLIHESITSKRHLGSSTDWSPAEEDAWAEAAYRVKNGL